MGAGGSLAGDVLKTGAPALMEWAQGIKTPGSKTGQALLDETKSIFPGGVRAKANEVLGELNPQLEKVTEASPAMIPLQGAREEAANQFSQAAGENVTKQKAGIRRMANQLLTKTYEPAPGAEGPIAKMPIPPEVSATEYRQLKQGIGHALPAGSWNPESSNAFRPVRNAIYGNMAKTFHDYVPEAAPLDERISALIPATEEPKHNFGHLWGPGAGAMIGGFYGARPGIREGNAGAALMGGLTGAAEGGIAGFAGPTLANILARSSASPALQKFVIPAATGAALQVDRKKKEQ
jgi:hypothetical protein